MKKYLLLACLAFSLIIHAHAQQPLPNYNTTEELLTTPKFLEQNDLIRNTDPPVEPPRAVAEFEEMKGIIITWTSYTTILRQIVDAAQEEGLVYIVAHGTTDSNDVKTDLNSHGIPLTNVKFIDAGFNTIWGRDYGANSIYLNDVESPSLVDWVYNRTGRPLDDAIPTALATELGITDYQTLQAPNKLVHTGGNYMSDGHGTAFSSKLVLDENGTGGGWNQNLSEADIDLIMKHYMGINTYIKMETLPYDDIHHIDMHMKLLDEETLLVAQYPAGIADGPQIDSNLNYVLNNFQTCYGRPYKVIRIPSPPDASGHYPNTGGDYRTYANALIINKTVILPIYNSSYDNTAINIYKDAMPGYKIVGIDCNSIITSLGAIHCITHEIAVDDPIWISHASLANTNDNMNPYPVVAKIETPSGASAATMYWTIDTTLGFTPVTMTVMANDSFSANIPAQAFGTTVYYYINASSNSGRNVSKPIVAPQGWFRFDVSNVTNIAALENHPVLNNPYPNPASTALSISFSLSSSQQCSLMVTDVLGRVFSVINDQPMSQGTHKISIGTADLAAGLYTLQLKAGNETVSKKFIVLH